MLFKVYRYRQYWHAQQHMMPLIVEAKTKRGAIRIAQAQTPTECEYRAYLMIGPTLARWARGFTQTVRDWV